MTKPPPKEAVFVILGNINPNFGIPIAMITTLKIKNFA